MRSPRRGRAALALLLVTLIWGWTFVWMKQGLEAGAEQLGEGQLVVIVGLFMTLRFGLATLLLPLLLPAARRELSPAAWSGGLAIGVVLLGGFLLQMFGLQGVSPPVSAFLTSLYVIFTALLSAAITRRALRLSLTVGVLLATFGAGFISGPPQLHFDLAEWLTVGCAFLFAVHIVLIDRITARVSPAAVTFTSFVVVTAGSALLLFKGLLDAGAPQPGELLALAANLEFLLPLLLTSVLATVLAMTLMNTFQRDLPPVRAAILYAIEPIWATLVALALGMERWNTWLLIGGGALLLGNLVAEVGPLFRVRLRATWN